MSEPNDGEIDRYRGEWAFWCYSCGEARYGYRSDESAANALDRHLERCPKR